MSRTIHGLSGTRVYKSWDQMKQRCENPKCEHYYKYGGRGISICQFIRSSPANIIHVIGNRPDGLSIDRIDNNGNYSCGSCPQCLWNKWTLNVRWATWDQQAENRRSSKLLTFNGVTKTGAQWAKSLNMTSGAFYKRIRSGKLGEDLFAPVDEVKQKAGSGI